MTVESNYILRFLRMMKTIPGKLDSDSRIASLLYRLRIEALIPFHQKLLDRLEESRKLMKEGQSTNITDVFIEFKVSLFPQI